MIDGNKLWSCVGSAGIVDPADVGKVVFAGPVAQMPGLVLPDTGNTAVAPPPTKAVIRYPVTPVDGVGLQTDQYILKVLARQGRGGIQVRFLRVPIIAGPSSEIGGTPPLIDFPIQNDHPGFAVTSRSAPQLPELDFVNNCYYVEITLSERIGPITLDPPGVAVIQLAHGRT